MIDFPFPTLVARLPQTQLSDQYTIAYLRLGEGSLKAFELGPWRFSQSEAYCTGTG